MRILICALFGLFALTSGQPQPPPPLAYYPPPPSKPYVALQKLCSWNVLTYENQQNSTLPGKYFFE